MNGIVIEERDEDTAFEDARQRDLDDAADALKAYEDAARRAAATTDCPKCGGDTAVAHYGPECSAGCDTSVRYCLECEWQGQPE